MTGADARGRLADSYRTARAQDFPLFPQDDGDTATPFNTYPFHARFNDLEADWAFSEQRRRLVQNLERVIAKTRGIGVKPMALLIGGSFADRSNATPEDIDVVIYYVAGATGSAGHRLATLERDAKRNGRIDCRMIPIDVDPLITIRATAFFSILCAMEKSSRKVRRAPIYVDLTGVP
ncbi:MAG TPA: hypothetical protein DCF67_10310 [Brevundimonas sp.]|nr:hypothetical protein [Brevundimonas sp.]